MAQPNYAVLNRKPGQTKYTIKNIGYGRRKQRWEKYTKLRTSGQNTRFVTFSSDMARKVGSVESGTSEYTPAQ